MKKRDPGQDDCSLAANSRDGGTSGDGRSPGADFPVLRRAMPGSL